MNATKVSIAAVLFALSLSSESHAERPTRAPQTRAKRKAGRGAGESGPARFDGRRSRKRGARTLPTAVRNPKPPSPSATPTLGPAGDAPTAPSLGKLPRSPKGVPVTPAANNIYRVLAHKYDSGSPKFRVQSVHGAKTVTVAGARFQGSDKSMMQFRYQGDPTEMLSLSCTLSMAPDATPSFEVALGASKGTVPLPAGESIRTLKYKAPMKGSWKYVTIKSKTPDQAWTWHECTMTVE